MNTQISKAEEKRKKQAREYIDFDLRRKLTDFENNYLNQAANWEIKVIESDIRFWENEIIEIKKVQKHGWEIRIQNLEHRISRHRVTLSRDAILKMNAFNKAKESYNNKVQKVVELLVFEGFSHLHLTIEEIRNIGSELEFLISNDVKEVHARLIFVNGDIKAPHFRFITTVRAK